jgi:hypothetical protein
MSEKLNTHYYDGHDDLIQNIPNTPIEVKQKLLTQLLDKYRRQPVTIQRHVVVRIIEKIMRDINTPRNYDSCHKVACDDILAMILQHPEHPNVQSVLDEMLYLIETSGDCPQGRSLRLYQIYSALYSK